MSSHYIIVTTNLLNTKNIQSENLFKFKSVLKYTNMSYIKNIQEKTAKVQLQF